MSHVDTLALVVACMFIGGIGGLKLARWLIDREYWRAKSTPCQPPITATYPARDIEVNGFRYVLDRQPVQGSAEGRCGCGREGTK